MFNMSVCVLIHITVGTRAMNVLHSHHGKKNTEGHKFHLACHSFNGTALNLYHNQQCQEPLCYVTNED